MKQKPESFNILLVGNWNRHIFNPAWVSKNIFKSEEVQVEFPINSNDPPRFILNNSRIVSSGNRLIFQALDFSDSSLKKIHEMAKTTLNLLPHTPLIAFGVNFGFQTNDLNSSLLEIFDFSDNSKLSSSNFVVKDLKINRLFNFNGTDINFTMNKVSDTIEFEFNYHFPVTNIEDANTKINSFDIINLKNSSIEILKTVYDVEIE